MKAEVELEEENLDSAMECLSFRKDETRCRSAFGTGFEPSEAHMLHSGR